MNSHNKNNNPEQRERNPAEYLVLGALAGGRLHGYDLHQSLYGHLGRIWTLGRSQTYALLGRMEQAGLVAHQREPQGKRPDRKIFTLTPAGRKAFRAWVEAPVEHIRDLRLEFLAKVHFLGQGKQKSLGKLIDAQQEVCRNRLFRMEEQKRAAEAGIERLTYDFRLSQAKAALTWLAGIRNPTGREGDP